MTTTKQPEWHKHHPDKWLGQVAPLTALERGIWETINAVLWNEQTGLNRAPAPTDDRFWSRACNCHPRTWRAVWPVLVKKAFLALDQDGRFVSATCRVRVEEALSVLRVRAEWKAKHEQNQGASRHITDNTKKELASSSFRGSKEDGNSREASPSSTSEGRSRIVVAEGPEGERLVMLHPPEAMDRLVSRFGDLTYAVLESSAGERARKARNPLAYVEKVLEGELAKRQHPQRADAIRGLDDRQIRWEPYG